MRRFLVVLALLSLLTIPVNAEWLFIAEDNQGDRYFYNTDGIERHEGFNRVWVRALYLKPTKYGIVESKAQYDLRATSRHFKLHSMQIINEDGQSFHYGQAEINADGDSVFEAVWKVCSEF